MLSYPFPKDGRSSAASSAEVSSSACTIMMLSRFSCATVGLIRYFRHRRTVKHGRLKPAVHETLAQGQRAELGASDPFWGKLEDYLRDPHGVPSQARW